jgi:copper chaperone
MFGIMVVAMIVIMMMFSGLGDIGEWMWALMILPFAGILIMVVIMLFFFRRMRGKGGLMSETMGHSHSPPPQLKEKDVTTLTYVIPAVSCDHCKMTVESEVGKLPGVASVNVDVASKQVVIKLVRPVTKAEIEALLAEIGYSP